MSLVIVHVYLCHTFHNRRSGVGLAVVNGQLFAVGGFDGTTYLKTIEASIKKYQIILNKQSYFAGG